MAQINSDFVDRLLDTLLEISALNDPDSRDMLLRSLPPGPASAINRSSAPLADLNNILSAVSTWGQLDSGEWALGVLIRNALRLSRGTQPGRDLQALLNELETQPADTDLPPLEEEEIVIGQDERLSASFVERCLLAARSIGKVLVPRIVDGTREGGHGNGSGWLMTPDLLLTNYHVVANRDRRREPAATRADLQAQAEATTVWFGYNDRNSDHSDYRCGELIDFDAKLDYAVLRLAPAPAAGPGEPLSAWGHLSIPQLPATLIRGDRLNIIQHPRGEPKQFAIRSNFYLDKLSTPASPSRIRYLTDTEPGASGSPVLDDDWQVVALHHASIELPNAMKYKQKVLTYNNQGVLIHAIVENLPDPIRGEIGEAQNWT